MDPVLICLLFVFILAALLLGLYFGIWIRSYTLNRSEKEEFDNHAANRLSDEELQKYAPRKPMTEKELNKKIKENERAEKETETETDSEPEDDEAAVTFSEDETVENDEDSPEKSISENETGLVSSIISGIRSIGKKSENISLKERIKETPESFLSEVCDTEGKDVAEQTERDRKSQDRKYDFNEKSEK